MERVVFMGGIVIVFVFLTIFPTIHDSLHIHSCRKPMRSYGTKEFVKIVDEKKMQSIFNFLLSLSSVGHFSWLRCQMKGRKMNFSVIWLFFTNSNIVGQMNFWHPNFTLLLIIHAWHMYHMSGITGKKRL